jgi:hypothetical protein
MLEDINVVAAGRGRVGLPLCEKMNTLPSQVKTFLFTAIAS